MRPTDFRHLLFLAAVVLATPAPAQFKAPEPAWKDGAARPDKMQPAPAAGVAKPLTPQGPLAAPAPVTGTVKPLTPQGPLAAPAAPAPRLGAGTSPNVAGKKVGRSGGDDDLDELEVERRKVQNGPQVGTGAPAPRPGAGTSPNTGRTTRSDGHFK